MVAGSGGAGGGGGEGVVSVEVNDVSLDGLRLSRVRRRRYSG
jgi:hypothetical protein